LCLCAWASAGHAQEVTSPRQHANAARAALLKKDYAGAVDAYRAAQDGGYHNADMLYGLACAHALQGQQEQALIALERSVAEGWRAADELEQDKDLAPLHGSPRWTALLRQARDNERAYRGSHASPETFKFLTGDIDLFWKAYEQLPAAPNPAEVLEHQYLDQGSAGLQDFVPGRIGSGEKLYQSMVQRPKYYAAIRPATLQVGRSEPAVREAMRSFKAIYDQALFPDVYFVMGAMNSGGTASSHGLLIGTEIFSSGNGVPSDELSPWLKTVVKSSDLLPSIVTHELMHFQQHLDPDTLLGHAIKEGSADFLASLVVQGNFNEHIYAYGYAHEAELKKEFFTRMHGSDMKGWLYGGGLADGRPADLGYFMGFRICQSYYQRAKDKKKAVAEMLNIKDFKRFLADSGYYSAN
jgi:hypothetical protein